MGKRYRVAGPAAWLVCFNLVLWLCWPAFAQKDAGPVPETRYLQAQFGQVLEKTTREIASLESDLAAENQHLKEDQKQQERYHASMAFLQDLVISGVGVSVLEKGVEEINLSMSVIQSRLQGIAQRREKFRQALLSTKERAALLDQRIQESESDPLLDAAIVKEYRQYRELLQKKQQILSVVLDLLSRQHTINTDLFNSFEEIRTRLQDQIKEKKGGQMFQRTEPWNVVWSGKTWKKEWDRASKFVKNLLTGTLLKEKWLVVTKQAGFSDAMVFGGLLLAALAAFRGLAVVRKKQKIQALAGRRTGYPLLLVQACAPLVIWLLLVHIFAKTRINQFFPDLIQFLFAFLLVVLTTRITFVALRPVVQEKQAGFLSLVVRWQPAFVWGIRIFAFLYLFIYRFVSFQSAVLPFLRLVFEVLLVFGIFLFFKEISRMENRPKHLQAAAPLSKTVVLAGLVADAAGYTYFAAYWYISWGITIAVLCITTLLVYSMQDVDQKFKQAFEPETGSTRGISYPFYWILSNGMYLLIAVLVFLGLAFSWGAGEHIFPFFRQMFTRQYTMGNIQLSLSSFFFAFLVIFVTYVAARFWKQVMSEKILAKSGLSTGAKDSVITISVYIVWAIGILFSLTAFGLNTTSLAVVFGALSIGLGFGLQNIFNNFVSGLILLFERPIQVGDVVEVGSIWGEVKKINVRATLVQTYDNASLIIPNSEFISSLVTNWSHRDPYIRRDLKLGVAYGSDTALVEKLLFQAADTVKEVYHHPRKPQVQFIDFGESSLDFRLRFWSTIDEFLTAETRLRFEIDRLFRENDVVIPFPQRDVHMKLPAKQEKAEEKLDR
ncbi:MAG: mechanosensitive ion channel [Desulfotignum sp.]|nr:mechanosensitive ion channel [Desulfotignum sp.]MCF8112319.1 mechanosensitive ion channel [Desulfotignum sp.]